MKGRHALKAGYRFILRKPSPFTQHRHPQQHLDQPQPDEQPGDQQPGLRLRHAAARLHDRRIARASCSSSYDFTNSEHSLFVQDDWKLTDRLTVNARPALRRLRPRHREARTACRTSTREGMRLVYAGEDGTDRAREQGDALGQPRPAPRRRLGRDRQREERACAPATAAASSRSPHAGRQPARPEGALHDLAELQRGDEPARLHARPRAAAVEPVPADRAGQAAGRRRSSTRPTRACFGHCVLERDAAHAHLAGQLRAPDHEHPHGRARLRRQQGLEPDLVRQHQRGPARPRLARPPAG